MTVFVEEFPFSEYEETYSKSEHSVNNMQLMYDLLVRPFIGGVFEYRECSYSIDECSEYDAILRRSFDCVELKDVSGQIVFPSLPSLFVSWKIYPRKYVKSVQEVTKNAIGDILNDSF